MVHCWVTAVIVLGWSLQSVLVVFWPVGLVLENSIQDYVCVCMCLLEGRFEHLLWICSQCNTSGSHAWWSMVRPVK